MSKSPGYDKGYDDGFADGANDERSKAQAVVDAVRLFIRSNDFAPGSTKHMTSMVQAALTWEAEA